MMRWRTGCGVALAAVVALTGALADVEPASAEPLCASVQSELWRGVATTRKKDDALAAFTSHHVVRSNDDGETFERVFTIEDNVVADVAFLDDALLVLDDALRLHVLRPGAEPEVRTITGVTLKHSSSGRLEVAAGRVVVLAGTETLAVSDDGGARWKLHALDTPDYDMFHFVGLFIENTGVVHVTGIGYNTCSSSDNPEYWRRFTLDERGRFAGQAWDPGRAASSTALYPSAYGWIYGNSWSEPFLAVSGGRARPVVHLPEAFKTKDRFTLSSNGAITLAVRGGALVQLTGHTARVLSTQAPTLHALTVDGRGRPIGLETDGYTWDEPRRVIRFSRRSGWSTVLEACAKPVEEERP